MDETFQFDIRHFSVDFLDVAEAHFAGHDDARCAVVAPEFRRCPVGRIGLGRHVDGQVRHELPGHGEDARIGDEDGVDADVAQVHEVIRQGLEVVVVREDIDCHVDMLAPGMSVIDGFLQFFIGEVIAESPQAEGLPAQVDGIGTVQKGHLHFIHTAGRSQQFHFSHSLILSIAKRSCRRHFQKIQSRNGTGRRRGP